MHWIKRLRLISSHYLVPAFLLCAGLVLAYEPLFWLIGSWSLPGYDGTGALLFVLVLALFGYSLSSRRLESKQALNARPAFGICLLLLSAGVRACAQVADINMLGALVLAVDVYAIALLLGTHDRQRRVAPFWLAILFCFCLPLEPWLQRLFGAQLQWLSSQGACAVLSLAVEPVVCDGVRIWVAGVSVLVDLACSGSQLLVQASMFLALLFACLNPNPSRVVGAVLVGVFLVWLLNVLRITLLALGLAYPPWGLDVMAPTPHTLIGLVCLALLVVSLLCWVRRWPKFESQPGSRAMTVTAPKAMRLIPVWAGSSWVSALAASAFVLLAMFIVRLDPQPLDRTARLPTPYLPMVVSGFPRRDAPLSKSEQTYYETYGGVGVKATYGGFGLLVVRTGAPIRHLHAPDVCLTGMGFLVDSMGTDLLPVPTAVYRATRRSTGEIWQVRVNYVADDGVVVASLSEVAWRWLKSPDSRWTMVQRLVPWSSSASALSPGQLGARRIPYEAQAWDTAVLRAFNLSAPIRPVPALASEVGLFQSPRPIHFHQRSLSTLRSST